MRRLPSSSSHERLRRRPSIAILEPFERYSSHTSACLFQVATWNRQAEVCDEYLSKGSKIAIDGRLRSRSWEDEVGKRRTAIEVVANRVEFLDARSRDETPFDALAPA